ncbi:hypothetical protein HanIR_Chr04g0154911 [Helianthus annuus]|nr:hypothetical protein HanIR_Chr04g0154911 [Helianthus annuus]
MGGLGGGGLKKKLGVTGLNTYRNFQNFRYNLHLEANKQGGWGSPWAPTKILLWAYELFFDIPSYGCRV